MDIVQLGIIFAILNSPQPVEPRVVSSEVCQALEPATRHLAIALELDNDCKLRSYSCTYELNQLRSYYQNLSDAPPLRDADRFVGYDCVQSIQLNNIYGRYLRTAQPHAVVHHRALFNDAHSQNNSLGHVWQNCNTALHCSSPYHRRMALRNLLDELGPDDYYQGIMPLPVPVWFMHRCD